MNVDRSCSSSGAPRTPAVAGAAGRRGDHAGGCPAPGRGLDLGEHPLARLRVEEAAADEHAVDARVVADVAQRVRVEQYQIGDRAPRDRSSTSRCSSSRSAPMVLIVELGRADPCTDKPAAPVSDHNLESHPITQSAPNGFGPEGIGPGRDWITTEASLTVAAGG